MAIHRPLVIPARRTIPGLLRDPLATFDRVAASTGGAIARVNLGVFRPYLVTRPEHVQHILRDNATNYARVGMMWKPLQRLMGEGLTGEGPAWEAHRRLLNPLFTTKHVTSLIDEMTDAIAEAIDELEPYARRGQPVDSCVEMTRIVHRVVSRVFFGGRVCARDADRLGQAIDTAMTSCTARILLPMVPNSIPMPGDRAFARAVRVAHQIVDPLVRESRQHVVHMGESGARELHAAAHMDMLSLLCQASTLGGKPLSDEEIRDDVVAVFAGGSESTGVALTWLWVVLSQYPEVEARLCEEIDRVVDTDRPRREHLAELRYTRMVLDELLRLYPVGWIIPRQAVAADQIDGVRIKAGATVLTSPYLTHRMDGLWERPLVFDPERFSPDNPRIPHRFAYFPFSFGRHMCVGANFFTIEAQLILAMLLRRYRPVLCGNAPVRPRASVSLRPSTRVDISLRPVNRLPHRVHNGLSTPVATA